ncbi:hypothetical protein Aura_00028 [Pseudomonas phage vB_PpuM-Aura]
MQQSSGRQELFLTRPEEVRVHYISNGESVDEAMVEVRKMYPGIRSPDYWVNPGEDATVILIYMRSGQVIVVDNEHLPRFVIQVPLRADGCFAVSPDHINGIVEDHGIMFGAFENNTVASLKVKGTAFRVQGESGCIDPAAFRHDLGETYAIENAKDKMYALEGYALARMLGLAGLTTVDTTTEYQTGFTFDGKQQIMFPDYAHREPDGGVDTDEVEEGVEASTTRVDELLEGLVSGEPYKEHDYYILALDLLTRAAEKCWNETVENGGDRMTSAIVFPGVHDTLRMRDMGTYLLDINAKVQGVTENKAMFFQCTMPGVHGVNLVLMNKEIGATMYPGDDGYFQLPRNFPMTNYFVDLT